MVVHVVLVVPLPSCQSTSLLFYPTGRLDHQCTSSSSVSPCLLHSCCCISMPCIHPPSPSTPYSYQSQSQSQWQCLCHCLTVTLDRERKRNRIYAILWFLQSGSEPAQPVLSVHPSIRPCVHVSKERGNTEKEEQRRTHTENSKNTPTVQINDPSHPTPFRRKIST